MDSRNVLEEGVRELARLEYRSAGSDHVDGPVRSRDSTRARLRDEVNGEAPAWYVNVEKLRLVEG